MVATWDPHKARTNLRKHGVRFSDAEAVLFDPMTLTREDEDANRELRNVSIGMDAFGRVLVVVYAYRHDEVRIISARRATRKERRAYEARV